MRRRSSHACRRRIRVRSIRCDRPYACALAFAADGRYSLLRLAANAATPVAERRTQVFAIPIGGGPPAEVPQNAPTPFAISASPNGKWLLCGAHGCWEAYTSNQATLSRYLGRELVPLWGGAVHPPSSLSIDDLIARARGGDARASSAIEVTGHYLGVGIAAPRVA